MYVPEVQKFRDDASTWYKGMKKCEKKILSPLFTGRTSRGLNLREALLHILILTIPLKNIYFSELYSIKISPPNIILLIAIVAMFASFTISLAGKAAKGVIRFKTNERSAATTPLTTLFLGGSVFVMVLSAVYSPLVSFSPVSISTIIGGFLIFVYTTRQINDIRVFRRIFFTLVVTVVWLEMTTIMCATGILPGERMSQMLGNGDQFFQYRTPGLISAFGDHAVLISLAAPFMIIRTLKSFLNPDRGLERALCWVAADLIVAAGIFSLNSRNVTLSISISLSIFFFLYFVYRRERGKYDPRLEFICRAFSMCCVSICLVTIIYFVWQHVATFRVERSFLGRLEMYKMGFEIFLQHPVFGIGVGAFHSLNPGEYIHNLFLSILVSGGVVSFAFFLAGLCFLTFELFKSVASKFSMNEFDCVIPAGFISAIIAGMFYYQTPSWIFWLCLGIIASYTRTRRFFEKEIEA